MLFDFLDGDFVRIDKAIDKKAIQSTNINNSKMMTYAHHFLLSTAKNITWVENPQKRIFTNFCYGLNSLKNGFLRKSI